MSPARVLILYTGGTIGSVPAVPGHPLSPLRPARAADFRAELPDLAKSRITFDLAGFTPVDSTRFDPAELEPDGTIKPLDSSNIAARHWLALAATIERHYHDYDGFVVLHGTDTMAYTASALSFLLENLAKPVVLTGSQLPIFAPRTDARQNLLNALHLAAGPAVGLPLIPEVIICFADRILRGNRARKVSTTAWAGFDSPNCPHLGEIGEHIRVNPALIRPAADNRVHPFRAHTRLQEGILDFSVYPGLHPAKLKAILSLPGINGILFRGFGAGNAPDHPAFLEAIAAGTRNGRTIVNVTQCNQGMVEMGLYAASSGLQDRGVISGLDLTPEAALTKLMYLLTLHTGEKLELEMQQSLRGEQSVNLYDVRYGGQGTAAAPLNRATDQKNPPPPFHPAKLTQAVLRLTGLGWQSAHPGDLIRLRVFLGPVSEPETRWTAELPAVPSFAGEITAPVSGDAPATLILDLTHRFRETAVPDGSPLAVTLVAPPGQAFWYRALFLSLFTQAD